ncbi:MAG: ornithine aminotransferase [Azospira oryzae]|nr:MAG: ornithine aminotransferase [Azospira oryzae]
MKDNADLQKDVQEAISWEPLLTAAQIGVTVKDGVVTLTGTVDNYAKKMQAEDAAKRVAGVKAVVEKIEVQLGNWGKTTDGEIATEVINALNWNPKVPDDKVKVQVEDGWVTLEGELSWNYQREAVRNSIVNLMGVKGVSNYVKIKPESQDAVETTQIERALDRDWSVNADTIKVRVSGTAVTLSGTVNSPYQKEEAERIVWKAPGVWSVKNDLEVKYDYSLATE